ncbi:MAG: hypothetical protein OEN56_08880 [Gemmatimonadota bacterium]|nr:hypothetical protein [Gemmatimonadota bacterium]
MRISRAITCASAVLLMTAGAIEAQDPIPRTPDGRPDLQGNWSNATMTPIVRPNGVGLVLTAEQVTALEEGRQDFIAQDYEISDPDREAPPEGGEFTGNAIFDAATGGTGGYNQFFVDAGDVVAVFNGEPRSSLIVEPENGRPPPYSEEGRARLRARAERDGQFGAYDNPENRPLAERCIMSFGSNAGPPMLPNYFYNNNYTIVQTTDHIAIMTEMVHDVRIIRVGERRPLPDHIRPWMGDSWGHWEGDTLVIETTNIHPEQVLMGMSNASFRPSEAIKVTERLTRVDDDTINYEFTVVDPLVFDGPIRGEVPFERLDGLLYEYACHEGNYAMENVLRGARAEEARERERR